MTKSVKPENKTMTGKSEKSELDLLLNELEALENPEKDLVKGAAKFVYKRRQCDVPHCDEEALYDAKTIYGPWGYLCQHHFDVLGVGLGMGKGQRLIVKEPHND